MKALFSGEAGLAVVLSEPPSFRPVNEQPYDGSTDAIRLAFDGFADIEEIDIQDDDLDELDRITAAAWAQNRALNRLHSLFDVPSIDSERESALVREYSFLVGLHKISADVEALLEGVDLGPAHEARAHALAVRYSGLRDPMVRLYPSIERSLVRKEIEAAEWPSE